MHRLVMLLDLFILLSVITPSVAPLGLQRKIPLELSAPSSRSAPNDEPRTATSPTVLVLSEDGVQLSIEGKPVSYEALLEEIGRGRVFDLEVRTSAALSEFQKILGAAAREGVTVEVVIE